MPIGAVDVKPCTFVWHEPDRLFVQNSMPLQQGPVSPTLIWEYHDFPQQKCLDCVALYAVLDIDVRDVHIPCHRLNEAVCT